MRKYEADDGGVQQVTQTKKQARYCMVVVEWLGKCCTSIKKVENV
ncbi:hypothetical protein MSSD14B_23670 [Marinobacter salsuginis]|uniref:Uncharacterized protein n=1 Tax=Marinobacter salsuginis TaxID=418719 RepID=A0A5M3Q138_9GAMM|nr:hypothetical protein MSSD14B_23670 [Marinobacter salsuginis]